MELLKKVRGKKVPIFQFCEFSRIPGWKPIFDFDKFAWKSEDFFFVFVENGLSNHWFYIEMLKREYPDENIYKLCGKNECMQPLYHIHIEYI